MSETFIPDLRMSLENGARIEIETMTNVYKTTVRDLNEDMDSYVSTSPKAATTTHTAHHPTSAPQHTSIETTLVEGVATIT